MADVIVVGVTAPQAPARVVDVTGRPGTPGVPGHDGWTPVIAVVQDGARRVMQVQSWTGGAGLPPPSGLYVGPSGLTAEVSEALDVRGTPGPQGQRGEKGTDGAVIIGEGADILTGDGPPDPELGAVNQLYIDTLTGDLYKKKDEETWELLANLRGPDGADGAQGVDGEPGPPGQQGINGLNGWTPVYALVADGASRTVLQVTDWTGGGGGKPATGMYVGATGFVSNIAQAVSVRGPQGVPGQQGTRGEQGVQGIEGPAGAHGDHGWSPVLANVVDGARRVFQVVDWSGGQGTKPATGLYVGAGGLTADISQAVDVRGAVGAQGERGPDGPEGPQGAPSTVPGPPGTSVHAGASDPSSGLGNNGDVYVNTASGDLFKKAAGAWALAGNLIGPEGPQGPKGDTGDPSVEPGPAGTSIYTATSNPTGSDGNNGDSWINSLTGNIYLKTGPTTWTLMGNLKGPQGDKGDPGDPGQIDPSAYATAADLLAATAGKVAVADTMLGALAWQTITYGAAVTPNMNSFINATITLTGDMTLNAPSNVKAGRQVAIKLQGNDATVRTVTFGSGYVGDIDALTVSNADRAALYIHALGGGEFLVAARAF